MPGADRCFKFLKRPKAAGPRISARMNRSVAIIGTGISGLSCGRRLAAEGVSPVFFEKSRSLAGRCATRKWNGHVVDHGAQFFTIRDAELRAELEAICPGQIVPIEAPVLDAEGTPVESAAPRCHHSAGNNRLGRALLGDLPARMETLIEQVEPESTGWRVGAERFDAVVSCAPWPQSARIFGVPAGEPAFAPCLTALLEYAGEWAGNSREAYARTGGDALMWSACENHKPGRVAPGRTVFVAQASPEFSEANLERDPEEWLSPLRRILESRWELRAEDHRAHMMHRWRFARATRTVSGPLASGLFLTGDSRTGSRVEAAWLAGRETASAALDFLAQPRR